MAEIVYLRPDQTMPDLGDDQRWITIEATRDGLFYGTGGSFKMTGEWVGYCSLPEDDVSIELALEAAIVWAQKYAVPTIWIQLDPDAD